MSPPTAAYTVGQVLPGGATVASDAFRIVGDVTVETMVDTLGDVTVLGGVVPGSVTANQQAIVANIQAHMVTIQAWIAANPTGAVLTPAQTLVLAKMLYGLGLILSQNYATTVGT